jgi:hypothetical protein
LTVRLSRKGEYLSPVVAVRTDIAVGDLVEWDVFRGIDCGVISAITETRVYVRNQRRGSRGRAANKIYNCEFWWDAHEVHRLRRIESRPNRDSETVETRP